ncbi:MAG: MerC domain-containing protein [Pseudomonadota bacterium]
MVSRLAQRYNAHADRLAVALSGLCIVHCISIPVLLVSSHLLGGLFAVDQHFHEVLLLALLPISAIAFGVGYRRHQNRGILFRGGIGLLIVTFAATVGHHMLGPVLESIINIAGSVLLILAHRDNVRLARAASGAA